MLTESSDALQEALVSGFVIFMMVSVGLDLTADKLKAVFRAPRVLFSALTVNYGIIPLVFLALIQLTGLEGMWATGLLFVAVAPGGPVAVVLIQNARGHLARRIATDPHEPTEHHRDTARNLGSGCDASPRMGSHPCGE